MSKGSRSRLFSMDRNQFDNIFGKNKAKNKLVNDQKVSYNQEHQLNQESTTHERAVD